MTQNNHHQVLLHRHPQNPILTAADWPYAMNTVFNAGAVRLPEGDTLLLCRVEDRRGHSHLCVARSRNGVDAWQVDSEPTFRPDPANHPEEEWGIEDPRITYLEEEGKYAITYTGFSKRGAVVCLALTGDFQHFERIGPITSPWDKDAAFLPRKFDGRWLLVHRPTSMEVGSHMWISFSPDLRHWGDHKLILRARKGAWWDADKIGLSTPPIETEQGWLTVYHGVRRTASGSIYRLGLALFDLEDPTRCLQRSAEWFFGPEMPYEIQGDVDNVVFPCGFTIGDDGDTLNLYYGGADSCIALATSSIRDLLEWLAGQGENGPDAYE